MKSPIASEKEKLDPTEYSRIHQYLRLKCNPPQQCKQCGLKEIKNARPRIEWALIRGRQYSKDISDYIHLCRSCHRKYDTTDIKRNRGRRMLTGNQFRATPVKQYDLEGNFIKEYPSITIAARETGSCLTSLAFAAQGVYKTANHYIWKR